MGGKEAFCLLLWRYQGGQISAKGLPIYTSGARASGYCDNPGDCYRCPLMQEEIALHPPGHANWVCPACLKDVIAAAEARGIPVHLTGHYTEGQCQYKGCTRPPRKEFDSLLNDLLVRTEDEIESQMQQQSKWADADVVERPKGYSRLLQLVIGDINS